MDLQDCIDGVPSLGEIHDAYRAASKADDAWHAELVAQFGPKAVEERYRVHVNGFDNKPAKGCTSPLYVDFRTKTDHYFALVTRRRAHSGDV